MAAATLTPEAVLDALLEDCAERNKPISPELIVKALRLNGFLITPDRVPDRPLFRRIVERRL